MIPHGGAALPLLADRVQAFQTRTRVSHDEDDLSGPPFRPQLRQLWYDTAGAPFPHQIPALTRLVGDDLFLYDSDYCWTPPAALDAQLRSLHQAAPTRRTSRSGRAGHS